MSNSASALSGNAVGIDVSAAQSFVNWQMVKDFGFSFAFIKATQGTGIFDSQFNTYWPAARAVGILRGGYHFYHPTEDPLTQAHNFLSRVKPGESDLPPALDLEGFQSIVTADNMAANIAGVRVWLETVENQLKLRPVIYTGMGFWNEVIKRLGGVMPDWLRKYPLWAASWATPYVDGVSKPFMPIGWNSWTFWQFGSTDNPASMPIDTSAMSDGVDIDFFHGTVDQLRLWIGAAPAGSTQTNFRGSNQDVINVFFAAFGEPDYFDVKMVNAGLADIANDRDAPYTGPAVEDLPNLSEDDRQALRTVLGGGEGVSLAAPLPVVFDVQPRSITRGQTVTASWSNTDGASGLFVKEGDGGWIGVTGPAGSRSFQPGNAMVYSFKAVAPGRQDAIVQVPVAVTNPLVAQPRPVRLGINVLFGDQVGKDIMATQPGLVSVTFDPDQAFNHASANPGTTVLVRPDLGMTAGTSPDTWRSKIKLERFQGLRNVILLGSNEEDNGFNGDQNGIIRRAVFDKACLQMSADQGVRYACGSWSVGGLDVMNSGLMHTFVDQYAPLMAAGAALNLHCYMAGQPNGAINLWDNFGQTFETSVNGFKFLNRSGQWSAEWWRWLAVFLVEWGGLPPASIDVYSDEIGIEGHPNMPPVVNAGGFAANGVSGDDFVRYVREFRRVSQEPTRYDGKEIPSNYRGGCFFMANAGNDPRWSRYNMDGYWRLMVNEPAWR